MHLRTASALVSLLLVGLAHQVVANPLPPNDEASLRRRYTAQKYRADTVKKAFQTAWNGYYKYAFPHDSLRPATNTYSDDRNGWGASAVDAFSTALVMKNWGVVNQILDYVPTINFSNTSTEISLFETTIRYLGGMLSAYDLMTGPLWNHAGNDTTNVTAVLVQAQRLADNLKVAFDTPSGVPDNMLKFGPPRKVGQATNGIATIGTLVLEWTRLSDLTGNPEYGRLAQKAESYLLHPRPALGEPFPGLLGTNVNITTGLFVDSSGGWGGGDDSFYEYLIKMYLYDPLRFREYGERWVKAVDSSIQYLTSHPTSRPDLTFLAMWNNRTLQFVSEHLACFNGGNFILGGLTLDEPIYVRFGLDLVDSCHETYVKTATGIGPEVFSWQDSRTPLNATNNPGPPAAQAGFYNTSGFWISNGNYVLRPEVLESIYYAYRATGDKKYQEWAWASFQAINATCRIGSGYSSVNDVNAPGGGGFSNFQESFWFAEVLKYSYLIFAEDAPWQVQADHTNQFVYNTECHPIRIASGHENVAYGST
ncbi:glycoside hydrolase family 47 protein [Lasiosphaeria miniovina]|uniref:alpha-1,2-Mannosidase n=1 Tax=Lasiosphaeria miniovina TaxID=1954250 RepID=A0AA40A5M1_9PEZI|nr:glycoside hydrolase family 47 protein [Lasiosphaeria miniovina]KAK0709712.1 glycoside hydrolase family 47 protein [Lasiosphaeria miniovina]